MQRNKFFLNYANFLLLKLNDCIKNIDIRYAKNEGNGGFTDFYIPFPKFAKKIASSLDEAIKILISGVDGQYRPRRTDEISVILLTHAPLLLKD